MKRHKVETELSRKGLKNICGLDEAGRGPIAGPVVGAAVILPPKIKLPGLKDSKLLSEEKREKLFHAITRKSAYGIGIVDHKEIDKIGILDATQKAFNLAIENLQASFKTRPEYLLIDGRDAFFFDIPYISIIKGDMTVRCIAAASIVAKVVRDKLMREWARIYPQYHFRRHKGYATRCHQKEIEKYGWCDIHRESYRPIKHLIK